MNGLNLGSLGRNKTVAGIIGGMLAKFGQSVSPTYGPGGGLALAGMFLKNDTLETLGGVAIGTNLAQTLQLPGGVGGGGGFL